MRSVRRFIPAAGLVLALVGGGVFAAASQASETEPAFKVPEGFTVADPQETAEVTPQIVGGTSASFSSAPWMVQLLFDWNRDGQYYFTCGGTLVAPNKVLTAAHCLHDGNGNRQDWGRYGLVLGGTGKLLGGADNSAGTAVDVTRSWVRSGYDDATIVNDIAVLTLAKPLPYATLPVADSADAALYTPGTAATTYGWGMTSADSETGKLSPTLLKASMPINADAECATALDGILGEGTFRPGAMLCAGEPGTGSDATGISTCPGDSGGPLVAGGRVVGVVSWGVGTQTTSCNVSGSYDVFTKVSSYASKVKPRVDDTDLTRNGKADLLVRAATGGKAYRYNSTGSGFSSTRTYVGDFGAYNMVLQADMDRDGHQDFILRSRSTGAVYWRHRTATSSTYTNTKIASDWSTRKRIITPGDVTGDQLPDLLSVTSGGTLYVYPGRGNGTYGTRITAGTGYGTFNSLRGKGDFTGDGRPDLIARGSGGAVYLLKGTGKASAPFERGIQVRDWDSYNAFAAPGDVTGDGRADFVARTSGGTLYLYPGTGKASSGIFADRVKIGTGWNQYNIFA